MSIRYPGREQDSTELSAKLADEHIDLPMALTNGEIQVIDSKSSAMTVPMGQ